MQGSCLVKAFLRGNLSKRWGVDGWALIVKGAQEPWWWTTSTTRQEARELKAELERNDTDFFRKLEVVKVNIEVTAIKTSGSNKE